jgi:hypothetical protein
MTSKLHSRQAFGRRLALKAFAGVLRDQFLFDRSLALPG